jgi:hypothetical protein
VRQWQPPWHDRIDTRAEATELGEEVEPRPPTEARAEERIGCYPYHHRAEFVQQVEFALAAEVLYELCCPGLHYLQVAVELTALEPGEYYLALPLVLAGFGEEIEVAAEQPAQEGHPVPDGQALIGLFKKYPGVLRPGQDDHRPAADQEHADVAVLAVPALNQRHRIAQELQGVADDRKSSRHHGRQCTHETSFSLTC